MMISVKMFCFLYSFEMAYKIRITLHPIINGISSNVNYMSMHSIQ